MPGGIFTDSNGNVLTSQTNGTQKALDVGIDVNGVQIDPRQVTVNSSTLPTGAATAANQTQFTQLFQASSSTVTSVNSSITNIEILAANTFRKGAIFYNNSTSNCYLKLGVTASPTSFSLIMQPLSVFIIDDNPIYLGQIDGIWVSANGAMLVTELT